MSTDLEIIVNRLSRERMGPYLATTGGDVERAVRLYEWNTALSGAFYESLQAFEVVLRNALLAELVNWHGTRPGDWFDDPRGTFDSRTHADVENAIKRLHDHGAPATGGRLVAELSFGFWRYLLTKRYTDTLWIPHLRHAFINLPPKADRAAVDAQIEPLVRLRNRIAHHEPIYKRDLDLDAKRVMGLTGWICKDTQRWMMSWSRIPTVIAAKP
jgi:hypothetical protein